MERTWLVRCRTRIGLIIFDESEDKLGDSSFKGLGVRDPEFCLRSWGDALFLG